MSGRTHLEGPGLIQEYLRGEAGAVTLVDGWIDLVLRRWGPSLRPEWDDLRQEVRARVFENLRRGSFDGRSSLHTYVHRIAQNVCIDRLRHARRLRASDKRPPDAPDPSGQEAGSAYMAREMLERILEGLPPGDVDLLRRVHVDCQSYSDLARKLGISEGAVKLRVFRLRERLLRKYRSLAAPGDPHP